MGRLHKDHTVEEWATKRLLPSEPIYVSVAEVCTVLGVSRGSVHNWIKAGLCPAVQVGGPGSSYRVPASWLINVCQQGVEYRSDTPA